MTLQCASFEKGEGWNLWVWQLTEIIKKAGLPNGVRKDADKRKSDKPSHFVALTRELQQFLPTDASRGRILTTRWQMLSSERELSFRAIKGVAPRLNKTRKSSP